jgi:hypothetical protein
MSEHVSFREHSRRDYGRRDGGKLTVEQINCGALLRIADATETMARNYVQMQADLDYYKTLAETRAESLNRIEKCNSALRGVITKLKRKHGVTGNESRLG